ncbi:hypothetical protein BHU72_01060 [Desulfuribacillus stibiiarsenatis]|uniref:DUF2512 domain-containing protein n=1 Tax=Desulfuribacillus stibiiarsenatis TaxID=1390249 RepID=A0A1E5L9S3_9FIRM|nr:DUF2512 family protein [Desulfuribacillus stibiiarsenatis]OEH86882.1 hypothetical protein BHU72_01060 [Desulfuribacillus stibiiarsenatis]
MNNTAMALVVKFVLTFGAAILAFYMIDGNPIGWVFFVALIGTVANYILGDLIVLPAYGNVFAAFGDGVMAAIIAYGVAMFSTVFIVSNTSLFVFLAIVVVAELFFHMYLKRDRKVAP